MSEQHANMETNGLRKPMKKGELSASFHKAGMRLTRQRLAIFRELRGRYDHPDVDTLFRAVKPRIPQISLFTVYRTMNALEAAGMVWRVATVRTPISATSPNRSGVFGID